MEKLIELIKQEDADGWETLMFLYNAALKEINTKIDILNGYETSVENMVKYVNDIAGIRIICSFTSDIYLIADMITKQSDLKVVSVKDYITHPKVSGYQSYHILVTVPIHLTQGIVDTIVEIQIRTIAQDFWASLEHKIYYKFEGNAPDYIRRELQECANIVSNLDRRMLSLNEKIQEFSEKKS